MACQENWCMPWIVATAAMLYKFSPCIRSNIDQKSLSQHTDLEFIPVPKSSSDCLAMIVDLCQDPESLVYREINTSDKSEFTVLCSSALFYLADFQLPLYRVHRSFWRGWKKSSHSYFWYLQVSFLTGVSDSLHKESRWALFWPKLTFPWFKAESTDFDYIQKNEPFPGLTHSPTWTVLALLCNINIPLQNPVATFPQRDIVDIVKQPAPAWIRMLFSKSQAKSVPTGCCYSMCQGHHILTGNSSSMIGSVSVSAEAKSETGRKQHRRTRQNKSIGNIINKTQDKKKKYEEWLWKINKFEKIWQKMKHRFYLHQKQTDYFHQLLQRYFFSSPADSMTHFWATTIYVILFLNFSWKKLGYEWHKIQLYSSDQFLELAKQAVVFRIPSWLSLPSF